VAAERRQTGGSTAFPGISPRRPAFKLAERLHLLQLLVDSARPFHLVSYCEAMHVGGGGGRYGSEGNVIDKGSAGLWCGAFF